MDMIEVFPRVRGPRQRGDRLDRRFLKGVQKDMRMVCLEKDIYSRREVDLETIEQVLLAAERHRNVQDYLLRIVHDPNED